MMGFRELIPNAVVAKVSGPSRAAFALGVVTDDSSRTTDVPGVVLQRRYVVRFCPERVYVPTMIFKPSEELRTSISSIRFHRGKERVGCHLSMLLFVS